jgi:hypothetical protein
MLAAYLINETAQPVRFVEWGAPVFTLSTNIEMRPVGSGPPPPAPPPPRVATIAARSRVALTAWLSLDERAYKPGGTADVAWEFSIDSGALTAKGTMRDQPLPSDGPRGTISRIPPQPPG